MGVHEATTILKRFLMELPDSLIPMKYDRYDLLEYGVPEYRQLISGLPNENIVLLYRVLELAEYDPILAIQNN